MRRTKMLWTVIVLVLATLALTVLPAAAAAPTARIRIEGFAYKPSNLTVSPGELIQVVNLDGRRQEPIPHTVTAFDGSFDSGVVWDKARITAPTTRGVYQYYCFIHPFMKGTIRVSNQA